MPDPDLPAPVAKILHFAQHELPRLPNSTAFSKHLKRTLGAGLPDGADPEDACHRCGELADTAVLCKLLEYYGIPVPNFDYVCTVKISQLLWPEMQNHKLDTVCSDLDIRLNHHEALSDARACGLIFAQALKSQHCFQTEDLMDALEMRIGHVSQAGRQSCSTSAEIRKKIQSEKKKQESRRRYYAKRRLTAEKGAKHS